MPGVAGLTEERRLSGDAGRRLRLGEAVQRADVPPFPRGLRTETRVARYHNVYGPHGTYDGGREKAPAAICRKVIQAKLSRRPRIDIWGDGSQTRSFTYITDCLDGTRRLMESDVRTPLNIGSSEMVTINQLVDLVEQIAGIRVIREYDTRAPQGVAGRNSDNSADPPVAGLGTVNAASQRAGDHLPMDFRPDARRRLSRA